MDQDSLQGLDFGLEPAQAMEKDLATDIDTMFKKIVELTSRVHYLEHYCPENAVREAREKAKERVGRYLCEATAASAEWALKNLEEELEKECQNTK